jgi:adenylylsulfate kinase-like enzyme
MGYAGAGKSTFAEKLVALLHKNGRSAIWLDGDSLRKLFDLTGHSKEERKLAGLKYLNLAKIITSQGVDVIISSIGMQQIFEDEGKSNFTRYYQVLISINLLEPVTIKKRSFYENGDINVMGKDIQPDLLSYDIVIDNKFKSNSDVFLDMCLNLIMHGKVSP